MPAPKPLRLCASELEPSRLARVGLAFAAALAVLALAACASASDDARTPPPTTTPIPTPAAEPAPPTVESPPITARTPVVAPIVTAVIATPTPVPRETAPAFDLPAAGGGAVSLSKLLEGRKAAVLVFYRGLF